VPGGGREHQIERLVLRGVDVLERALDDVDLGEGGQIAAPDGGQRRPRLDASDAKASAGQRQRRLAGGAPDLQQPVIRIESNGSDHRLVQLLGVLGPGPLVEISGRVVGHPQPALISHATIIPGSAAPVRDRESGTEIAGSALASIPAVSDVELVRIGPEGWREFREVRLASLAESPWV
jgi:hypothetical protein